MIVARNYAKALYEAACDTGTSGEAMNLLEKQFDSFVAMVDSSPEAKTALFGPVTNSTEKMALVAEFAKRLGLSPLLGNFLQLLAKKGRLFMLHEIRKAFGSARLELEGGLEGQLVSAEPMSESDVSSLAQAFGKKLGKKVSFRTSTDAGLLAGMKVTVNGVTYDGTLRSQLQRLREQVVHG
ncbi:MAG: ATP synthase F1 subunit delta [Bdellovibrionota bacterium]